MKFRVTMEDCGGVADGLREGSYEATRDARAALGQRAWEAERERLEEAAYEACKRWFGMDSRGNTLTVEIDTEAMTCVVVPR